ncbi:hypothetical protein MNV49_005078 [Pseudohyphozyma bogoriensis]|nr:hypothetical protein MNV49_005078 [Pseudohyphozyma bogoriensis]
MNANYSSSTTAPQWTLQTSPDDSAPFYSTGYAAGNNMAGGKGVGGGLEAYDLMSTPKDFYPQTPVRQTLRRAVSTGVLPTMGSVAPSMYAYQEPLTPNQSSPASDTLPTPRDGQWLTGGQPSGFALAQENFLAGHGSGSSASPSQPPAALPQQQQFYPNTSSPAYFPPSPASLPQSTPRHSVVDGVSGAQPRHLVSSPSNQGSNIASTSTARYSLPPQNPAISVNGPVSPTYQPVPYSAPSNLAVSQKMAQAPSREEVNQFLAEMNEMLGPETMAALSPPTQVRQIPTTPQRSTYQLPPAPPAPRSPTYSKMAPTGTGRGVYNVSGVLLDEADIGLFSNSRSPSPCPPATYPTYQLPSQPPAFRQPPYSSQQYFGSPPDYYNTYTLPSQQQQQQPSANTYYDSQGQLQSFGGFSRPRSAPSSPQLGGDGGFAFGGGHSLNRRRGSSMDGFPRVGGPYEPAYGYAPPSPTRRVVVPPKIAPKKPTNAGKGKKKGGGISFINFSANDANVLLSGVAPSGSSKRKREDDHGEHGHQAKKHA